MAQSLKSHFLCYTIVTGPALALLLTSTRGPRKKIRQTKWSGAAGRGRAGTSGFGNGGNREWPELYDLGPNATWSLSEDE